MANISKKIPYPSLGRGFPTFSAFTPGRNRPITSSMNRYILLLLAAAMPAAAAAGKTPTPPDIRRADGLALVALARQAMQRYLTHRTGPDDLRLPDDVKHLVNRPYAAAVTLRSRGTAAGRCVRSGRSLPGNVAAAALAAMRSPALPDRITAATLAALTIEVEVSGRAVDIDPNELPQAIIPALAGLTLTQGGHVARVFPATAYARGFSPDAIRRNCIALIPQTRRTRSLPARWGLFATRHYVGYPDGRVLWLYRGKVLLPPEAVTDQMLSSAAAGVGSYLLRTQDTAGLYRPAGSSPSLRDHLYATWAMARLARRTGRKDFAASVNTALARAARRVRMGAHRAWVDIPDAGDRLAGTALLALAVGETPAGPEQKKLHEALLRTLRNGVVPRGAAASQPATRPAEAADRTARAIAMVALLRAAPDTTDKALQAALEGIVPPAMGRPQPGRTAPANLIEAAWLVRAITAGGFGPNGTYAQLTARLCREMAAAARGNDAPMDEYGGLAEGAEPPSTCATALAAAATAEAARRRRFGTIEPERQALAAAGKMRRFCFQMMYGPYEAYFAARPGEWVGAVRAAPSSAKVTLEACAAAIEAFLAVAKADTPTSRGKPNAAAR